MGERLANQVGVVNPNLNQSIKRSKPHATGNEKPHLTAPPSSPSEARAAHPVRHEVTRARGAAAAVAHESQQHLAPSMCATFYSGVACAT